MPGVVLLLGPSPSQPGVKRLTLGRFSTAGWWLREPADEFAALRAAERATEQAIQHRELSVNIARTGELITLQLAHLYRGLASARSEVFIASELAMSAPDMFAVLLHEAAHAIADSRGIKDTSRQGRYHNGRFRLIGQELGLEGPRDPEIGWSLRTLSAAAGSLYRDALKQLEDALHGRPGSKDWAARAAAHGPFCECGD